MIAILHYGLGNIKAFANIYHAANVPYTIATTAAELKGASRIVLPGVGAFDTAMQLYRASDMAAAVEQMVLGDGVPVVGICVGMQMLARSSDEGTEAGLGWVDGTVRKIDFDGSNGPRLLPHMGWNTIMPKDDEPLMQGLDLSLGFYFLHSYCFECDRDENVIARADYGGSFACAVRQKSIYGVQFHPEKSHGNGKRLLLNFAEI